MTNRSKLTAAILTAAVLVVPSPRSSQESLEGRWEGLISVPGAPVRVLVRFYQIEKQWEATIDIPGVEELPLQEVRFASPEVHFELKVGASLVSFHGSLKDGVLSGDFSQGGQSVPFSLERLPELSPPANRVEAWEQDIDTVLTRFLRYDRSFAPEAKKKAQQALFKLKFSLLDTNDQEVIVALSRAVALSGNAHTRLYLLRNRTELGRYPLRVYWFQDGLYVVKATPDLRRTLGCRVLGIGGHDPEYLKERVAELFAGNKSWVDYKSPYFLTSSEILYGLGLIPGMERAEFQFSCHPGKSLTHVLAPLPLRRKKQPTEAWRELSPFSKHEDGVWISALDPDDQLIPLYLKHPHRHYWFEYLEEPGLLYFQYNRSQDMGNGESFAQFGERLLQFLDEHVVSAFVVDLRFNTGGNLGIAATFMEKLGELEKFKEKGKLFVIIGRATFSAGIAHAAQLKQFTQAIFVGEPVGDALDFWSEGGNILLPNSKLTVHFANGFHSYSKIDRPEFKPYYKDLQIDDLDPDIPAPISSTVYLAGRDPTLDAILSYQDE